MIRREADHLQLEPWLRENIFVDLSQGVGVAQSG
jgi:hypothetical protein